MNDILASVPVEDRCPSNQPDGAHAFKRGAFVDSPIRCRYCGVKQPAAGDPTPTNPTAREQLFRRVAGAFVDETKANALLDAYRAEVLAEAIEAAESRLLRGSSDALVAHHAGVSDAIAAIRALTGGESRG
ncbi:hypothetical protein ACFY7Y_14300 [Streptomyces virginiae]|uniref:hypothetical protein n=1 Tax=Streptomyces virginiae TaxID=1961 RepID=UPI0036B65739